MRPNQHIISTKSIKAFESFLPDEWIYNRLYEDYGIDYYVDIYKCNIPTGKAFYVQLKGTNKHSKNDIISVPMKLSTLNYYHTLTLPILLVMYSIQDDRFWGMWVNQYLNSKDILSGNHKSVRIEFGFDAIIDHSFFERIADNYRLNIPDRVGIYFDSNCEYGEIYHKILLSYIQYYYPGLFFSESGHYPNKISFKYQYNNYKLGISLTYNSSDIFKFKEIEISNDNALFFYNPIVDFNKIPLELSEPLFQIALIMCGKNISSSLKIIDKLICSNSCSSSSIGYFFEIGRICIEKRLISDLQNIINKTIECKKLFEFQILNTAYMYFGKNDLAEKSNNYIDNLFSAIEATNDDALKGMFYYNIANGLRNRGDLKKAIKCYFLAKKYNKEYINYDYWWFEIAGALFVKKHYIYAEHFYKHSLQISKEVNSLIYALIADCLLFQGKFSESLDWLYKYFINSDEKYCVCEFRLKEKILKELINKQYEIITINRKKAEEIINAAIIDENENYILGKCEEAIKCDPTCGLAWFNYGVSLNKLKRYNEALFSFTVCCIFQDGDKESWLNALFLSFNIKEDGLFLIILNILNHKFGESIFADIVKFLRKQNIEEQATKYFINNLAELFDHLTKVKNS